MDSTKIKNKLSGSAAIKKTTAYYERHKRLFPILSFIAGFIWDSFTLRRIDLLRSNLVILFYLLLLALLIVLNYRVDRQATGNKTILHYSHWFPSAIQFFLGGLFSIYVVFYFRSAAFSKSFLFLLLLIVLLIVVSTDFIKDHLANLVLNLALYFLSVFSFLIFFIPVLIKKMNTLVFLFSGFLSLFFLLVFLFYLSHEQEKFNRSLFFKTGALLAGIFLILNLLYFLNWIPPVPLSLEQGGIYHHIIKKGNRYELQYEKGSWYTFFKHSDHTFYFVQGDTAFCFASIFAPTKLEKKIFHRWQYYDPAKERWLTTDLRSYRVRGGREGGYRGYTYKKHLQPGHWRVDVETAEKQLLGRITFTLITDSSAKSKYPLQTVYY